MWISRFVFVIFFNVEWNVFIRWCGNLFINLIVFVNKNDLLFGKLIFCIDVFNVVNNIFFLNICFFFVLL